MAVRLLVLGGTRFLGRAVVSAALDRGWDVTIFRRGLSGDDPAGVHGVRGDYADSRAVVRLAEHGPWDAVIDTVAFVPRQTLAVARALRDHVRRYVVVSTVSAYRGWPVEPLTEHSPVLDCPSDAGPSTYGFGKAGCERAVVEAFGEDRATILRPGVILGPHEYVGRLPWWLRRLERGGRVLAPGAPGRTIQPVDVRDVADFALRCAEGVRGVVNVTAPGSETFGDFVGACAAVAAPAGTEVVWVPDEFLVSRGIRQWTGLPLWRTSAGAWDVDSSRARATGLTTRPLIETVRDTWEWLVRERPVLNHARATELGITAEREAALLAEHGSARHRHR